MSNNEISEKKENVDLCLYEFLSFILNKYGGMMRRISNGYYDEEKRVFMYNCAMYTIDEFLDYNGKSLVSNLSSKMIIEKFKENLKLEHFKPITLNKKLSKKTELILFNFKFIKYDLDSKDKTEIIEHVENILTSTI